jgi:hypothetical protein
MYAFLCVEFSDKFYVKNIVAKDSSTGTRAVRVPHAQRKQKRDKNREPRTFFPPLIGFCRSLLVAERTATVSYKSS